MRAKCERDEKLRASNIVWTSSERYTIDPGITFYDKSGRADLYMNYIVGAVHKYYDYDLVRNFFADLQENPIAEFLENLMWIGLESCAFKKGVTERPAIEGLRSSWAQNVLLGSDRSSANYLFDEILLGRCSSILGRKPRMTRLANKILSDLEFDDSADTAGIIHAMNRIIRVYFGFGFLPAVYGERGEQARRHAAFSWPIRVLSSRYRVGIVLNGNENHIGRSAFGFTKFISLMDRQRLEYIESYYGKPILTRAQTASIEKDVCTGNHDGCGIHITRGEIEDVSKLGRDAAVHRSCVSAQRERNREFYAQNLARIRVGIFRLSNAIKNVSHETVGTMLKMSQYGRVDPGRAWRSGCLRDNRIFIRGLRDEIGDISVDLMLDGSASRDRRQSLISSQAYIIAQSLTECGIPVRVYSFCSEKNYTIINLFRDYREWDKNPAIFNYCCSGCNRDGLAIRTALYMMRDTRYVHKMLILLSDGVPNDLYGIPSGRKIRGRYDYIGKRGDDDALEVRKGWKAGVSVLCVFTGDEADIDDAKRIYGRGLCRVDSLNRFSDAVGTMLRNELENI